MYIALNAPVAVLDITPASQKDWILGAIALLGALAAIGAALSALYIANRDRKERARERQIELKNLAIIVSATVEPEVARFQRLLRQLYETMHRATNARARHWPILRSRIEWLEGQLSLPAIDRFLKDLHVLEKAKYEAYSRMFGLLPSLIRASEQLRNVPNPRHFAWGIRFSGLEYGIGNFAALLWDAQRISPGDPFFGALQTAKDFYEKELKGQKNA